MYAGQPGTPGPSLPPRGAPPQAYRIPGMFRSGGATTNYGGNAPHGAQVDVNQAEPGWATQQQLPGNVNPGGMEQYPGNPNPGGLDSLPPGIPLPGSQQQGNPNLQALIQQRMGNSPHMPAVIPPGLSTGAAAIHIAPFQQALQQAIQHKQTLQGLPPGVGIHPQVDRIHAVHAGSSIAHDLVQHFAGTLRRNQGRGV